jgi:hypothetical protein
LFLASPPAYAAPLARARIDKPSNKGLIAFMQVSVAGLEPPAWCFGV